MKSLLKFLVPRQIRQYLAWKKKEQRTRERFRAAYPTQPSRKSRLPGELIVSLTSYPARFRGLSLVLESLARQTTSPDRIVLWVAHGDRLPWSVRRVKKAFGVEIRYVPDVRSYKKLVFALEDFPDSFIATADDDMLYPPDWLEKLTEGYQPGLITCWRAHRFPEASPLPPYRQWPWDVQDESARRPSADLLPTGAGGILYPPGCFHPDVTDRGLYMSLCPDADDIWFYWQARRAGMMYKKVGGEFERIFIPDSQDDRLFNGNSSANDHRIAAMMERYGSPLTVALSQNRAEKREDLRAR